MRLGQCKGWIIVNSMALLPRFPLPLIPWLRKRWMSRSPSIAYPPFVGVLQLDSAFSTVPASQQNPFNALPPERHVMVRNHRDLRPRLSTGSWKKGCCPNVYCPTQITRRWPSFLYFILNNNHRMLALDLGQ